MIFEPQIKNSGFRAGKFLEKGKYKNEQENNRFFEPVDFLPGKRVRINSYDFLVSSCDNHTKQWLVSNYNI